MAGELVVADVCRYFVNMSLGDKPAACIVDMAITGETDRLVCVTEVAAQVLDAWAAGPLPKQNGQLNVLSVSWIDLDSLSGSTGSINVGVGGSPTWPSTGSQSGASQPSNVALRVDKQVAAIRGLNRGRMYIPGVSDGDTDVPNIVASSRLTAWQTNMNTFLSMLSAYNIPSDPGVADFCVVHKPESGSTSYSLVSSLTVQAQLHSQGRRLR